MASPWLRWCYSRSSLQRLFPSKTRNALIWWSIGSNWCHQGYIQRKKYQDAGLVYLQLKRWYMKLCCFYKVQVGYGGKSKQCLPKYGCSAPFNITFHLLGIAWILHILTYLILLESLLLLLYLKKLLFMKSGFFTWNSRLKCLVGKKVG